jgi:hypothetical protein
VAGPAELMVLHYRYTPPPVAPAPAPAAKPSGLSSVQPVGLSPVWAARLERRKLGPTYS